MLKVKKIGEGHQHPKIDDVKKVLEKESVKRLNADLPKSFYLQVKNFANEKDKSITDIVKLALADYMKSN
ncbi:hypothetical protein [Vibrio sp. OPT18]|uniref:hypothetical protein n=1 Tax=Vibrio sp. OPT18 TaxID=2778641 RepID=UPI001882D96D|nr:hypothetical protein [Vibrio sp. OPT18]MBE8574138.1 hypothetical protein [Vibrio sp. OPT18]